MQSGSTVFRIFVFLFFVNLFLRKTSKGLWTLKYEIFYISLPWKFILFFVSPSLPNYFWFELVLILFISHMSNFSSVNLFKIFQDCSCIFQNDRETRLPLFVSNLCFNWWPQKQIRFKRLWLAIINREEPKKIERNSSISLKGKTQIHILYFMT